MAFQYRLKIPTGWNGATEEGTIAGDGVPSPVSVTTCHHQEDASGDTKNAGNTLENGGLSPLSPLVTTNKEIHVYTSDFHTHYPKREFGIVCVERECIYDYVLFGGDSGDSGDILDSHTGESPTFGADEVVTSGGDISSRVRSWLSNI